MAGGRGRKQTSAQKIVIVSVVRSLQIQMLNVKRLAYFQNIYKRSNVFLDSDKIYLRTREIFVDIVYTFFLSQRIKQRCIDFA